MPENAEFSHVDDEGKIRMVDVGGKRITERTACAEAIVHLGVSLASRIKATGASEKGSVVETARIAGIMAAKQTAALIPLCHQIPLSVVSIDATWGDDQLRLVSRVRCHHTTGVEMEALTAVSVAALTVYDMCKAVSKGIEISRIRLLEKTGGKSGTWLAPEENTTS